MDENRNAQTTETTETTDAPSAIRHRLENTDARNARELTDTEFRVSVALRTNPHVQCDPIGALPSVPSCGIRDESHARRVLRRLVSLGIAERADADSVPYYFALANADDEWNETLDDARWIVQTIRDGRAYPFVSVPLHLDNARSVADAMNENARVDGDETRYFATRIVHRA